MPTDDENESILLGEPFAIISGGDFHGKTLPVAIDCDCGQPFQFDALNGSVKGCPHCGTRFTHVLLIAPEDNAQAARDLVEQLLANATSDEIDSDPSPPPPEEPAPATTDDTAEKIEP